MKNLLIALTVLLTVCTTARADFSTPAGIGFQMPSSSNSTNQHQRGYSNWVSVGNGDIPKNAVAGGYQSSGPLYICRTNYNGSMQPGKMLAGKCNIGYGGREIALPNFEALIGHGYQWMNPTNGYIPTNAVIGGYQQHSSYTGPLYVCRGAYGDGVHPGKLIAGKCNIGYGGREIALSNYQVLTQR